MLLLLGSLKHSCFWLWLLLLLRCLKHSCSLLWLLLLVVVLKALDLQPLALLLRALMVLAVVPEGRMLVLVPVFVAGAGAVVGVFIDAITFLSLSFDALSFFCVSFKSGFEICEILTEVFGIVRPASSFPLPGGLSGAWLCPPCGGGSMPLGASPGPLTSISSKSLGLVFLDIRNW